MSILDPDAPAYDINGKRVTLYLGEDGLGTNTITEEWPEEESPKATVLLQCFWPERYDVFKGLRGYVGVTGNGVIQYNLPFAYPDSPNLFCTSIGQVQGVKFRRTPPFGGYQLARFPAIFTRPRWSFDPATTDDPSGKPWTTTRVRVSAEVTTVPLGTFVWTGGTDAGKPVPDSSVGVLVPRNEISMTRHWMPFVPLQAVNQFIGTVNAAPVPLGEYVYDRGQLLFAGFNAVESVDTLANRTYEVEYVLLGAIGHEWNQLLDRGGVYRIVNTQQNQSGKYPFAYTAFWNALP